MRYCKMNHELREKQNNCKVFEILVVYWHSVLVIVKNEILLVGIQNIHIFKKSLQPFQLHLRLFLFHTP
jgi:hypothetical protein